MSATLPRPAVEKTTERGATGAGGRRLEPVVLLGGAANAVSVARSLGRLGAEVYVLNDRDAFVNWSRFARRLDVDTPPGGSEAEVWADYLLGPRAEWLAGAVVLTCSDAGLELLAEHRAALSRRFLLDESNPAAQRLMLNKLETYRQAVAAGVPTPRFWVAASADELESERRNLLFPLIVKPRVSHVFEGATGRKLLVVSHFDELAGALAAVAATGTDSVVMELVPGPDDRLCSYYTYLDAASQPQFHFTKRIIRRYPALRGTACYHVTDHVPDAAELGNRLFQHVGLRGLANVEFKLDVRDRQLKLIECNARFTASNGLVARSGIDLAQYVYQRLTNRPLPRMDSFTTGLRLWDPIRDFQSYREQRYTGGPSFLRWASSVLHRQTFPYFEWSDPGPALSRLLKPLHTRWRRAGGRAEM